MSLQVSAADAFAYRSRLKRTSLCGKRRTPLMDSDQRVTFLQKLEVTNEQTPDDASKTLEVLTPMDPEIPGEGQSFCGFCARHFVSPAVLAEHELSKTHRRRKKEVISESQSMDQELISELAVGFTRETKKLRQK